MAVGAFVNAEIEKRGTMISEKSASEILEKSNKRFQTHGQTDCALLKRSGKHSRQDGDYALSSGTNWIRGYEKQSSQIFMVCGVC